MADMQLPAPTCPEERWAQAEHDSIVDDLVRASEYVRDAWRELDNTGEDEYLVEAIEGLTYALAHASQIKHLRRNDSISITEFCQLVKG